MIDLVPDQRGARYGWRLVGRTSSGADVLARATAAAASESGRQTLERLGDGDGTLTIVAAAQGHLKWQLTGADGEVIAESPPVYRDDATCRAAFTDAQRAARTTLGVSAGGRSRPGPSTPT